MKLSTKCLLTTFRHGGRGGDGVYRTAQGQPAKAAL